MIFESLILLVLAEVGETTSRSLRGAAAWDGHGAIAAGCQHTAFLRDDGNLFTVGSNYDGQLGFSDDSGDRAEPMLLATGVVGVAAGCRETYWLTGNGEVWGTGSNWAGQLCQVDSSSVPIRLPIAGVKKLITYSNGVFFLKTDGTVWSCGRGASYIRGDGKTSNAYDPVQVPVEGVRDVFAHGETAFFVTFDGTAMGTGKNSWGNLGDGTTITKKNPVEVMKDVAFISNSFYDTFFVKANGSVWATGRNWKGSHGDGTDESKLVPVHVHSNMAAISTEHVNNGYTLFVKNDGSAWSAGWNYYGRLGNGGCCGKRLDLQQVFASEIKAVSAGGYHSVFVKSDGSVWAAGSNFKGALGDLTRTSRYSPVHVFNLDSSSPAFTTQTPTAVTTYSTATVTATTMTTTSGTMTSWRIPSTKTLQPIFGSDRACRGKNENDNQDSNYEVHTGLAESDCKQLCLERFDCTGVEHSEQRCEIWKVPIESSKALSGGFSCWVLTDTPSDFQGADGGYERSCQGESGSEDVSDSHYQVREVKSLHSCIQECRWTANCRGVQHTEATGRCELWTVVISSTAPSAGTSCFRYAFEPQWRLADGGIDRACRGYQSWDNSAEYFSLSNKTESLRSCQAECASFKGCIGVEFSTGRCELWTRSDGLGATKALPGFTCLRYDPALTLKPRSEAESPTQCPHGWKLDTHGVLYGGYGGASYCGPGAGLWGSVSSCGAIGSGFVLDDSPGSQGYVSNSCGWQEWFSCKRCLWSGPVDITKF